MQKSRSERKLAVNSHQNTFQSFWKGYRGNFFAKKFPLYIPTYSFSKNANKSCSCFSTDAYPVPPSEMRFLTQVSSAISP